MVKRDYVIRFVTPAFLGDAEQKSAWRTPPFKALLRQWWRIVKAKDKDCQYNYMLVREKEGHLFGHAWLDERSGQREKKWAMKSQIQIRLSSWKPGELTKIKDSGLVCHPEVDHVALPKCPEGGKGRMIEANLYLGFGPLTTKGLSYGCAIGSNDTAKLSLIYPKEVAENIKLVVQMMQIFGTVGSRSRNGWGSFRFEHGDGIRPQNELIQDHALLKSLARPIKECLSLNWPHAIGLDEEKRLLVWRTRPLKHWSEAIKQFAKAKIAFRTSLSFSKEVGAINGRHILAYPVTHHSVRAWGKGTRLANQLRFKVLQSPEGQYIGIAYHLPCKLPNSLADSSWPEDRQIEVWHKVHQVLDQEMTRIEDQGGNS